MKIFCEVTKLDIVPIGRLGPIAYRLTREVTTAIVQCVLKRPAQDSESRSATSHLAELT
jgi:hypothetical protein